MQGSANNTATKPALELFRGFLRSCSIQSVRQYWKWAGDPKYTYV